MDCTEVEVKSMNRTSNKEQSWITIIIEGKPGRGKPKTPFMKQVIKDIGIRIYRELKRNLEEREKLENKLKHSPNIRIFILVLSGCIVILIIFWPFINY